MEIRKARSSDASKINQLLYQVAHIHAVGRPDVFKPAAKKYTDGQLMQIINEETTPIFVATENGEVVGYAFCIYKIMENNALLRDKKTLYIDDLCVDEKARGKGVGARLYDHVVAYARENHFDNITLNVWEFNQSAYKFYEKRGMTKQRIIMEKTLND